MGDRGPDPAVSPEQVLEKFLERDDHCEPLTTAEVAKMLDIAKRTALKQLNRAEKETPLESKKVGASARVWWLPSDVDRNSG